MTCETVQRATHPLHRRGKRCLHHSPRLQPVNGVARICGDFHLPFGRSSLPLLSRSVVNIRQSTAVDVRGPPWARAPGRRGGRRRAGGRAHEAEKLRQRAHEAQAAAAGRATARNWTRQPRGIGNGHPLRDGRSAFGWLLGIRRGRECPFFSSTSSKASPSARGSVAARSSSRWRSRGRGVPLDASRRERGRCPSP